MTEIHNAPTGANGGGLPNDTWLTPKQTAAYTKRSEKTLVS